MNSADAELWDWMRILMGGSPFIFLIEVIIRVTVIYLLLLGAMRIMGKRMSAMISRNEMIAMISLAAAVGLPMQDPQNGLLPAFIIAGVVIGIQRIISSKTLGNPEFEIMVVGDLHALTQDGRLNLKNMLRNRISRERMLTEFRVRGVNNLGKVQRAFLEANGAFTIYFFDEEREGLCILPSWDKEFIEEMTVAPGSFACGSCGNVVKSENEPKQACDHCSHKGWHAAIRS